MASRVHGINGTSVAVTFVGVVLIYSGIKGKRITTTVRDLIAGNNPATNTAVDVPILSPVTADPALAPNTGSPTGQELPDKSMPPIVAGKAMTPAQIYTVARQAGFNPLSAIIATAVALAESGGNPNSYNGKPPDNSYGLWQINMIGSLGPARRAQFGLSDNAQLFNPAVNARAAYAISSGGVNWQPWTTYTSGAYLSHLPAARAAANG